MREYFTTTQAAHLLSVSADTVLKWVRAGKIASYRTPGGHARIPAEAVTALLPGHRESPASDTGPAGEQAYRYCWQYYSGPEGIRTACRGCVAYRSQARRCYEMRAIPEEFGHLKIFCESSCEDCDFYQLTCSQNLSALIVSRSRSWLKNLQRETARSDLKCAFAASEYECALTIEKLRPDFIVLDCCLGLARTRELCRLLAEDPRIPLTRIILTSRRPRLAEECEYEVFGWIQKPFPLQRLSEFITGGRPEAPHEGATAGAGRPQEG